MRTFKGISQKQMSSFKTIDVNTVFAYRSIHLLTVSQSAFYRKIIDEWSRLRIETSFGILFIQKGLCAFIYAEDIFGIDKSAQTFLNEQYPEARFYSQSTPFIDYFSVKSRLGNSKKMYASIRKDGIDIYCFERGHLLLANSFECTHTEDRIYYLLYAWKQLEFNQERDELHLTGILPEKDVLMSELKKFILQVFIMNPATNIDMQALLTCE